MILIASRLFSVTEDYTAAEELKTVDYSGWESEYMYIVALSTDNLWLDVKIVVVTLAILVA